MKFAFAHFFILFTTFYLHAQCSEIELNTLQMLAKTAPADKETKILDLGFDLSAESGSGATNTRHYRKCWHTTTKGNSIFRQVILWRTNVNDITFLTLDETSFQNLKNEIDGKHSTGGGKQTVVGKMFRYSFDTQSVEGHKYYAVTVTLKG